MTNKPLHEMSHEEFEAYLKTNKITGMAAASAGRRLRPAIKKARVDHDSPIQQDIMKVAQDKERIEQDIKTLEAEIRAEGPEYIDIGPKNFTQAMGIFEVVILDAERKGRQEIMEEIRRMGRIADKLGEALTLLKECRKLTSNEFRLVDPADHDGEYSVLIDPLTLKLEAFFKECENL